MLRPPQWLCLQHGVEKGTSHFKHEELVQHLSKKREEKTKVVEMADMAEKEDKRKAEEKTEVTHKLSSQPPLQDLAVVCGHVT